MFTTTHTQAIRHWGLLTVCSIVLMLALVACGGGSTASSTPSPTPNPTATPSPTPPFNAQTYTGNGYTIDYPSDWKVSTSGSSVTFGDASGSDALVINVVDHTGDATIEAALMAGLQQFQSNPNYQQLTDVPATTTIGGDTWGQVGAKFDTSSNGQTTSFELIMLADNHPANSSMQKTFVISYAASPQMFDQANSKIFQPMLQTFRFSS